MRYRTPIPSQGALKLEKKRRLKRFGEDRAMREASKVLRGMEFAKWYKEKSVEASERLGALKRRLEDLRKEGKNPSLQEEVAGEVHLLQRRLNMLNSLKKRYRHN